MSKPHKFPDPKDFGRNDAVVFCPRKKILELYNQSPDNDREASNLSDTVQKWFDATARRNDWVACLPVKSVEKKSKYSGCVLFNGFVGRIQNNEIILPLSLPDEE